MVNRTVLGIAALVGTLGLGVSVYQKHERDKLVHQVEALLSEEKKLQTELVELTDLRKLVDKRKAMFSREEGFPDFKNLNPDLLFMAKIEVGNICLLGEYNRSSIIDEETANKLFRVYGWVEPPSVMSEAPEIYDLKYLKRK